jgi:transcriptional regulator with XRE-family HTH domain
MQAKKTTRHRKPLWAIKVAGLRKRLGKTQEEFAGLLKVTRAAASLLESGRLKPSSQKFVELAKLAGPKDPDYLWFWEQIGLDRQSLGDIFPKLEERVNAVFGQLRTKTLEHYTRTAGAKFVETMKEMENRRKLPPTAVESSEVHQVVHVPLVRNAEHLSKPFLAEPGHIEAWLPIPASAIRSVSATAAIRVPDRFAALAFLSSSSMKGREDLHQPLFDQGDILVMDTSIRTSTDLWDRIVAINYVPDEKVKGFGELERRPGLYVGCLVRDLAGGLQHSVLKPVFTMEEFHASFREITVARRLSGSWHENTQCQILGEVIGWISGRGIKEK